MNVIVGTKCIGLARRPENIFFDPFAERNAFFAIHQQIIRINGQLFFDNVRTIAARETPAIVAGRAMLSADQTVVTTGWRLAAFLAQFRRRQ
uniref:Uncharacterized protein n=1 Tax=Romanomermis culicivorax TaxID=13658 RepID=A0A915JN53_ROMCU